MEKYDTDVESVDVVGQQINRLADRRLAQCGSGHLQRFAVDKRAASHADLHAHVQDTHHIWMNDKHVDSGAQNDTDGATIRVGLVNFHGVKVEQHPAQ